MRARALAWVRHPWPVARAERGGRAEAAAECGVERDEVLQFVAAQRDERLFGGEQAALGIEHFEILRDAVLVARLRQLGERALRGDGADLRGDLFAQITAAGERIGHFTECGLHRLFIAGDRYGFTRAGDRQIALARAPIEDRQRDGRAEAPPQPLVADQIAERGRGEARLAGERDRGEEGGACGPDIGPRGAQLFLGLQDIGAVGEQIGRQAGGDIADDALIGERGGGRQPFLLDRCADEQADDVALLRPLVAQRGDLGFGLGQQHFGLAIIERGGDAGVEPQFGDPQALPPRHQGAFGQIGLFGQRA